jgi:hypothetical protein
MLLTNRLFTRREPDKDAKSLYVFCEGKKREYQYFRYFQGIDSRINIELYTLKSDENNSPTGLYDIAKNCCWKSAENPAPKYELLEGDEVWFVIDTDRWGVKIPELRALCLPHSDWKIAQSNPCFEVWLYFHLFDKPADFPWGEICETWKTWVNDNIPGGFNPNKHPIYIGRAIENAGRCFVPENEALAVGSTEVFRLAQVIYGFCKWKIEGILNKV